MNLVRLATFSLEAATEQWKSWTLQLGNVRVQTHGSWRKEKSLKLLASATLRLSQYPEITSEDLVIVPADLRSQAEFALETAANLISIIERSKRSISSPTPCVVFIPESKKTGIGLLRAWYRVQEGRHGWGACSSGLHGRSEAGRGPFRWRLLLAEAMAHEHATGKFHELNRFFERAFTRRGTHLVKPLFKPLEPANLGYTKAEIKEWVFDLRHPATHADRNRSFLLESDVRPVVGRMEQAAYEVLLKKEFWRNSASV